MACRPRSPAEPTWQSKSPCLPRPHLAPWPSDSGDYRGERSRTTQTRRGRRSGCHERPPQRGAARGGARPRQDVQERYAGQPRRYAGGAARGTARHPRPQRRRQDHPRPPDHDRARADLRRGPGLRDRRRGPPQPGQGPDGRDAAGGQPLLSSVGTPSPAHLRQAAGPAAGGGVPPRREADIRSANGGAP